MRNSKSAFTLLLMTVTSGLWLYICGHGSNTNTYITKKLTVRPIAFNCSQTQPVSRSCVVVNASDLRSYIPGSISPGAPAHETNKPSSESINWQTVSYCC